MSLLPSRCGLLATALLLAACDPPPPQPTTGDGPRARWSHGYRGRVGA